MCLFSYKNQNPVLRQETRWSSTNAMVKTYFELLEFIDADDRDVEDLMLPVASNRRMRALFK